MFIKLISVKHSIVRGRSEKRAGREIECRPVVILVLAVVKILI